jgi:hypothetical protein
MSIVFTSKINSLVINPEYKDASNNVFQNTICKVKWTYTASQNGFNYSVYPQTELEYPTSTDFVDYKSLTEAQILEWVIASDTSITAYQNFLIDKLNELNNLVTVTSFHWDCATGTTGTTDSTGQTGITGTSGITGTIGLTGTTEATEISMTGTTGSTGTTGN